MTVLSNPDLYRHIVQSEVAEPLLKASGGERLTLRDVESLLRARDLNLVGMVADSIRKVVAGDTVTYIPNQILNYTNVCIVRCRFCAFYRDQGDADGYTLRPDEVVRRALQAWQTYRTRQVLIQGGVNPNCHIEYFEEVFREIKKKSHGLAIHGLSTSEIEFISRAERMSLREVLSRLKSAGLDSVPGAGGEILVDSVRRQLGRTISTSEGYLRVMEEAHKLGIPTSATMMYGHVESVEDRARHLLAIRELQEKTGGFMAFIPWNFEPGNTRLQMDGTVTRRVGGIELLRVVAAARATFQEKIRNIQSSWLTAGIPLAQLALMYGANDWGGTIFDEEVIPATGREVGNMRVREIVDAVRAIGRPVAERDNFYNIVDQA